MSECCTVDELLMFSQCVVILVCIYDAGELKPCAAVTRPLRHPRRFLCGNCWGSMHVTT